MKFISTEPRDIAVASISLASISLRYNKLTYDFFRANDMAGKQRADPRAAHGLIPGNSPSSRFRIARQKCYTTLRRKFSTPDWTDPTGGVTWPLDDPDKTDLPCPRSRSRPLHRGRASPCRTSVRAAVAEIHADPPPGAAGAVVQPPPARRL